MWLECWESLIINSFYMERQLAIIVNGYDMMYKVAVERGIQYCGRPKSYLSEVMSKERDLGLATGDIWKQQRFFADRALQKLGMKRKSYEKHYLKRWKRNRNSGMTKMWCVKKVVVSCLICKYNIGDLNGPKWTNSNYFVFVTLVTQGDKRVMCEKSSSFLPYMFSKLKHF